PRVPGGRRVPAGRLRVRALPQTPRRGAVALRRRGTDIRLLPERVLLSGPCPRRTAKPRIGRRVQRVPRDPRRIDRRQAGRGNPPQSRSLTAFFRLTQCEAFSLEHFRFVWRRALALRAAAL